MRSFVLVEQVVTGLKWPTNASKSMKEEHTKLSIDNPIIGQLPLIRWIVKVRKEYFIELAK